MRRVMYVPPKRHEANVRMKKSRTIEPIDVMQTVTNAKYVDPFQKVVNAHTEQVQAD